MGKPVAFLFIRPELFLDSSLIDRWYGEDHGNFHKMYIAEIQHIWIKKTP